MYSSKTGAIIERLRGARVCGRQEGADPAGTRGSVCSVVVYRVVH